MYLHITMLVIKSCPIIQVIPVLFSFFETFKNLQIKQTAKKFFFIQPYENQKESSKKTPWLRRNAI